MDLLPEMLSDEGGDLLDAVVCGEEGAEANGAVEHLVQFVDIGHALGGGELEEFLV